jgi:hypothetical protein
MSGRSGARVFVYLAVAVLAGGSALAASPGDVVINEMYCDASSYFDMSEFIELYNTTDSEIDVSGWVLTGIEFDQICQEHHHQFPSGTTIPAHGYLVFSARSRDVRCKPDELRI